MISVFMSVDQIPWRIPSIFPTIDIWWNAVTSVPVISRDRQIETVIIQREAETVTQMMIYKSPQICELCIITVSHSAGLPQLDPDTHFPMVLSVRGILMGE